MLLNNYARTMAELWRFRWSYLRERADLERDRPT
jgi:hypothetical protein